MTETCTTIFRRFGAFTVDGLILAAWGGVQRPEIWLIGSLCTHHRSAEQDNPIRPIVAVI